MRLVASNVEVQTEMGKRWSKPLTVFPLKIFEEGTGKHAWKSCPWSVNNEASAKEEKT